MERAADLGAAAAVDALLVEIASPERALAAAVAREVEALHVEAARLGTKVRVTLCPDGRIEDVHPIAPPSQLERLTRALKAAVEGAYG